MNEWLPTADSTNYLAFQVVALPIVVLFVLRSLSRAIRGRGPRWSAWSATLLWTTAALAILRPQLTNRAAAWLGIGRGADLLLYLLAIAFLASFFYFYQRYRRLDADLTRVVRELAIRDAARGGDETATRPSSSPSAD